MLGQFGQVGERLLTELTLEGQHRRMYPLMLPPIRAHVERLTASPTSERPQACMNALMHAQAGHLGEGFEADCALKGSLTGVHPFVLHERTGCGEVLLASIALVGRSEGMDPFVRTQGLASGEGLAAEPTVVLLGVSSDDFPRSDLGPPGLRIGLSFARHRVLA